MKRSTKLNNTEAAAALHSMPPSPSPHNVHKPRPSPRPPPVPDRPASYTPSTADSVNTLALNNFDSVRNYGSAADELENIADIRYPELPEFLQNLNVDKKSSLGRSPAPAKKLSGPISSGDNQALHKRLWDPDNPNIADNYVGGTCGRAGCSPQQLAPSVCQRLDCYLVSF